MPVKPVDRFARLGRWLRWCGLLAALVLLGPGPVSPAGSRSVVYAQNRGEVAAFYLSAAGELDVVPGSPFAAGDMHDLGTPSMARTIVPVVRTRLLFVSAGSGLSVFRIEQDGSLTQWAGSPIGGAEFVGLAVFEGG